MQSSDTAEIYFEDVRVPQSHVIGEEGKGFVYQMLQFQEERLFACASGKNLSYIGLGFFVLLLLSAWLWVLFNKLNCPLTL